jgi:hypothetical protein
MRIAIVLNEHGEPAEIAADGEIELLIILRRANTRPSFLQAQGAWPRRSLRLSR